MPTQSELLEAGRSDLAGAIRRYGSWKKVAEEAGLVLSSIAKPRSLNLIFCTDLKLRSGRMRPYMYWRNFENLRRELSEFITDSCAEPRLEHDDTCENVIPRASELEAAGRSDLARAIRIHGGWKAVATRLNIQGRLRSGEFWADFGNVEAEVKRIAVEHMAHHAHSTMPSLALLKRHGPSGLYTAITRRHGGAASVAKRLGLRMAVAKKPRGFWVDKDNLREEVLFCLKALCDSSPERNPRAMPTHGELVELGRFDVSSAIDRWGGARKVATMLGLRYTPRNRRPLQRPPI